MAYMLFVSYCDWEFVKTECLAENHDDLKIEANQVQRSGYI